CLADLLLARSAAAEPSSTQRWSCDQRVFRLRPHARSFSSRRSCRVGRANSCLNASSITSLIVLPCSWARFLTALSRSSSTANVVLIGPPYSERAQRVLSQLASPIPPCADCGFPVLLFVPPLPGESD